MATPQSFANHFHRPTETVILWSLSLVALVLMVLQFSGYNTRDYVTLLLVFSMFLVGWISRAYIVRLQDRIIMLESKVRAAELLPAGQDAALASLTKSQIVALRFASDEEYGALLARAAREKLSPKDIKAAIRTWRPDPYRT